MTARLWCRPRASTATSRGGGFRRGAIVPDGGWQRHGPFSGSLRSRPWCCHACAWCTLSLATGRTCKRESSGHIHGSGSETPPGLGCPRPGSCGPQGGSPGRAELYQPSHHLAGRVVPALPPLGGQSGTSPPTTWRAEWHQPSHHLAGTGINR